MTIDERQHATQTWQAIQRQPANLRTMFDREHGRVADAADILASASRVITLGIGSSHHASQVSAWLLREAGKDALAIQAFDFLHYPEQFPLRDGDAALVFGHTGSTSFTRQSLAYLIANEVPAIAVGSTTADHPGAQIILRTTEPEKAATYTSSHLCAMAVIAQLAVALGANHLDSALQEIPGLVAEILSRESDIASIAELAVTKRIYAYGAGPNEITATELMIKVREAAFHDIDGLAAEQFLHGPTVSFNKGDLAIAIHVPGPASERVAAIARVNAAMGGEVWSVGSPIPDLDAHHFALPEVPEAISPLLAVVPMQLLASRMAAVKATNPDEFRMDDPRYHAAFTKVGF